MLEAMLPYFHELYGNPSSMHSFGGQVMKQVRKAREQVATLLGASPEEIIFTSCGTESDSAAIRSALASHPDKKHIVTSRVEHPAVRALCAHLATQGYRVTELPVDGEGRLDLDQYRRALTPDTAIVSLMWANNETGVIFPIEKAAEMARERSILFHTDAVQSVGKIPIDLAKYPYRHALAFRTQAPRTQRNRRALPAKGHQVFALPPGGHQEKGRRGGTEATPSIIGLGVAAELAQKKMQTENTFVKACATGWKTPS